jgi:hypothetical protein
MRFERSEHPQVCWSTPFVAEPNLSSLFQRFESWRSVYGAKRFAWKQDGRRVDKLVSNSDKGSEHAVDIQASGLGGHLACSWLANEKGWKG